MKSMKREDILGTINDLSKTQGFYSRLKHNLEEMFENDYESFDNYLNSLEDKQFKDPVDLVMYLESESQ